MGVGVLEADCVGDDVLVLEADWVGVWLAVGVLEGVCVVDGVRVGV